MRLRAVGLVRVPEIFGGLCLFRLWKSLVVLEGLEE